MVIRREQGIRRGAFGLTFVTALVGMFLLGWSVFTEKSFLGGIHFEGWEVVGGKLDGLTAFFLFILLIGQGLSSLYGMSYMKEYEEKKSLLSFAVSWIAFLISMAGVLLVTDGFYFLIFWEVMSLFSFFLVLFEHEERANRKAAFIYLVMTHIGTVFLTTAILYLYAQSGSFAFSTWASFAPHLSSWERNFLFLCLLVGLGTKAGLVPFHIWLPYAHPVAPTPVSALMSGVMVKVPLYLMLRFIWIILNPVETWWGGLLLFLGVLSAFLGILYASVQQDVKRLLAYSTVENVGILAMALGVALLAKASGYLGLAQLALAAFFWHTLQHLLFKSTLFMVAGNLIQATHTRRLEQMGGLLKYLPKTGFWALWGAMGLAALPPLGGFWGEWLLFHALWGASRSIEDGRIKLLLPLAIALLGFISAMALATMVKWFASAFLGQPRSQAATRAKELPKRQTYVLGSAIALGALGVLWPKGVFQVISLPLQPLFATASNNQTIFSSSVLTDSLNQTVFSGFYSSVTTYGVVLILLTGLIYFLTKGQQRRVSSTWNCGAPLTPRMQYSSQGITMPLLILFKRLLGSHPRIEREFGVSHYFLRNLRYQGRTEEWIEEGLYRPSTRLILWCADRIRTLQAGSIHIYLAYTLVTLVVVLIWSL